MALLAEGDLRRAYNFIETIVEALPEGSKVTEKEVAGFCRERSIRYDRDEDEHYDTASAFIKSMWQRSGCGFVLVGENVGRRRRSARFIARRLVIFASEGGGWLIQGLC